MDCSRSPTAGSSTRCAAAAGVRSTPRPTASSTAGGGRRRRRAHEARGADGRRAGCGRRSTELAPDQRAVILLRIIGDLTIEEIALRGRQAAGRGQGAAAARPASGSRGRTPLGARSDSGDTTAPIERIILMRLKTTAVSITAALAIARDAGARRQAGHDARARPPRPGSSASRMSHKKTNKGKGKSPFAACVVGATRAQAEAAATPATHTAPAKLCKDQSQEEGRRPTEEPVRRVRERRREGAAGPHRLGTRRMPARDEPRPRRRPRGRGAPRVRAAGRRGHREPARERARRRSGRRAPAPLAAPAAQTVVAPGRRRGGPSPRCCCRSASPRQASRCRSVVEEPYRVVGITLPNQADARAQRRRRLCPSRRARPLGRPPPPSRSRPPLAAAESRRARRSAGHGQRHDIDHRPAGEGASRRPSSPPPAGVRPAPA